MSFWFLKFFALFITAFALYFYFLFILHQCFYHKQKERSFYKIILVKDFRAGKLTRNLLIRKKHEVKKSSRNIFETSTVYAKYSTSLVSIEFMITSFLDSLAFIKT